MVEKFLRRTILIGNYVYMSMENTAGKYPLDK